MVQIHCNSPDKKPCCLLRPSICVSHCCRAFSCVLLKRCPVPLSILTKVMSHRIEKLTLCRKIFCCSKSGNVRNEWWLTLWRRTVYFERTSARDVPGISHKVEFPPCLGKKDSTDRKLFKVFIHGRVSNNFYSGYFSVEDIKVVWVITHNLLSPFHEPKCIRDLRCSSSLVGYPINTNNFCTVHDYVNVVELQVSMATTMSSWLCEIFFYFAFPRRAWHKVLRQMLGPCPLKEKQRQQCCYVPE